ncbi:MAG: WG repeat-containing protein [Aureispira sp.]
MFVKKEAPQSKFAYTFEEWTSPQGKNRLLVKQEHKYGYANLDSVLVIIPQYDSALYFNTNKYTLVPKKGLWGVIDESGRILVDCYYDSIQPYNDIRFEPYMVASKNQRYFLF